MSWKLALAVAALAAAVLYLVLKLRRPFGPDGEVAPLWKRRDP